jgi:hypothetical protein
MPSVDVGPGFGTDLNGGRHVACYTLSDGGVLWEFRRPATDDTDAPPHVTTVRLSADAFKAMMAIGLRLLPRPTSDIAMAV